MKKYYLILLVFVSLLMGAGCSKKDENVLVVLTSSGYAPYELVDEEGNLTGFDIELMDLLASELGYTIEWKDVSFDGLIASMVTGRGDLAIAGLTPTEERAQQVDFSNIYYGDEEADRDYILVKTDSGIDGMSNLTNKKLAIQLGTVQAEKAKANSEEYGYIVEERDYYNLMVEELKANKIDGIVIEKIIGEEYVNKNDNFKLVPFVVDDVEEILGNAIAFPKGSELVGEFNEALAKIKESGQLADLIAKWFV